jgi:hypothetical protein
LHPASETAATIASTVDVVRVIDANGFLMPFMS